MREALMMDDYPLTLSGVADRAQRFSPTREVVYRRPDGSIGRTTFGDVIDRAHRIAGALTELGIGPGDPVATLMWNQPEHVELYFGVPAMGAVCHTLNPRLSADELRFIVADAQDRVLVVDESLLDVLASFAAEDAFEHVIVVRHGQRELGEGMLDYEALIASAQPLPWPELDERTAAAICYTSGTTGRPKGVVYSHRSLVLHSLGTALPDVMAVTRRDTLLPVVPMFHANAWGVIYSAALIGAKLVLPGPRLDPESVLELLESERVTMTAGVPTVWMAMLNAIDAEPDRWDLSALSHLVVGGAAAPQSLMEGFDRHGLTIHHAWGMTEMSPLGTYARLPRELDDAPAELQYADRLRQGIAAPLVEIRARDDEGELVEWDDESMGELEVRGPWVARGYLGGAGADRFTDDGWFKTGDVVTIDERGSIRIHDRSKDLVKSGGEWISSVDLENRLMAHPDVAEAAVIAIPDEQWGERPLAAIVLREGRTPDPEALRAHLEPHYIKWQIPDRFEFVSEIPRTATGKFKKTALRERFAPAEV